jgi:hypothetical protein
VKETAQVGHTYGRWFVKSLSKHKKSRDTYFDCRCECGTERPVASHKLTAGLSKSCGCIAGDRGREMFQTHGMTDTPEFRAWSRMMERGRGKYKEIGIAVVSPMDEFEEFFKEIGPKPSPKHTIDRIDSTKHYEKGNLRWATMKQQCNNRRTNRFLTFNGVTQNIQAWCEQYGISRTAIDKRIARKLPIESVLWEVGNLGVSH